jgi:P pilus assembly chaperone PapD
MLGVHVKEHFRAFFKSISIGLFGSVIACFPVAAQKFTVSPMVTITEARGGQSKGSINITNNGQESIRMRVYAESFTYDRKKGFTFTPADSSSAVPYLQFSPRELEIPPGVTRNVRVAVTLPANLPNQEYRAAVFIEDLKERVVKPVNGGVLSIKARVASVFFFAKGNSSASIQATTATWDTSSKKLSVLLENRGNQSAYPDIDWRLEKDGKEVAKDIARGAIVQSQNSREIVLQSNGQPLVVSSGEYKLSGNILVAGQKPIPFSIKVIIP